MSECKYLIINEKINNKSIELGNKTLDADDAQQKLFVIIIDNGLKPYKVNYKNS